MDSHAPGFLSICIAPVVGSRANTFTPIQPLCVVEKYFTQKRVEQHVGVLYGFEEASQAANSAGG